MLLPEDAAGEGSQRGSGRHQPEGRRETACRRWMVALCSFCHRSGTYVPWPCMPIVSDLVIVAVTALGIAEEVHLSSASG